METYSINLIYFMTDMYPKKKKKQTTWKMHQKSLHNLKRWRQALRQAREEMKSAAVHMRVKKGKVVHRRARELFDAAKTKDTAE